MNPSDPSVLVKRAEAQFNDSIELKQRVLAGTYLETLVQMAKRIVHSLGEGGKLMLCGNGGSAADAQHLAAELLVRLRSKTNRASIPALSLAMDTSTITACANDYGYDCLYERMVQGLGKPQDVLLGITTSGRSQNIIKAFNAAGAQGICTLGFLGGDGGATVGICDLALVIPSTDTNRIQETHITLGHILMDLIEHLMIEEKKIEVY